MTKIVIRRIAQVTLPVVAVVLALLVVPARADGPGYGGTADSLSVSWESGGQQGSGTQPTDSGARPGGGKGSSVVVPVADVTSTLDSDRTLHVGGVGFRGKSEVQVRVGSDAPFTSRVDQTGTLSVAVPSSTAETATTGTSVVAIGRSPAGTSMTLVGAIPPHPPGVGPVDLVPWLAAALAFGLSGSWLVSRFGRRREVVS